MTSAGLDVVGAPPAGTTRPWRRAILWGLFLAPFFYLTYGAANWLASLRTGVPSIVFDWERSIPFLDWTIVPYWSINGFYALSLFICSSKRELDTHGRRLLTAQVIAVVCFVAFPLRFTFAQPQPEGISGLLFAALTSFDKPFNQAPSLHIALLVILWKLYAEHLPRWCRPFLHGWFALVGLSVLTTYQHHFFDVPTGVLLGCLCLWVWPDDGASPLPGFAFPHDRRRRMLALRYAIGALMLAAAALAFHGAALWLFWPTVSLALVAASYAFLGVAGFQKGDNGQMSLAARLLLFPYLVAAWINSRAWTLRYPKPTMIVDAVWLSRFPLRTECTAFASIIDLSAELPGHRHRSWRAFPSLDLIVPAPDLLRVAADSIEEARRQGNVLVCCALGHTRSASAIAVWLLRGGRAATVAQALDLIRSRRSQITIDRKTKAAIAQAAGAVP